MNKTVVVLFACVALLGSVVKAAPSARDYLKNEPAWFSSDEGRKAMDNVLAWQVAESGGWPKNIDSTKGPVDRNIDKGNLGSFDNNATYGELRLLARAYNATHDERYRDAFNRGLAFIFKAQYPTGGWPQSWPLDGTYHDRITYNDDAVANCLTLIREIRDDRQTYGFVSNAHREQLTPAFDKGIDCILKSQIRVDGKLTMWCAQHDQTTLAPAWGRAFEPLSISGGESAGIVLLLMSIDKPSGEIVQAVEAAAHYYADNAVDGFRWDRAQPRGRLFVEDPHAPPMWARFYEIGTNKPIFVGRDGKISYSLWSLGRPGEPFMYNFFTDAGAPVIKAYPEWRAKVGLPPEEFVVKPMTPEKAASTQPLTR
jgi:pectate lyase